MTSIPHKSLKHRATSIPQIAYLYNPKTVEELAYKSHMMGVGDVTIISRSLYINENDNPQPFIIRHDETSKVVSLAKYKHTRSEVNMIRKSCYNLMKNIKNFYGDKDIKKVAKKIISIKSYSGDENNE